jgi:hypothetical protein
MDSRPDDAEDAFRSKFKDDGTDGVTSSFSRRRSRERPGGFGRLLVRTAARGAVGRLAGFVRLAGVVRLRAAALVRGFATLRVRPDAARGAGRARFIERFACRFLLAAARAGLAAFRADLAARRDAPLRCAGARRASVFFLLEPAFRFAMTAVLSLTVYL